MFFGSVGADLQDKELDQPEPLCRWQSDIGKPASAEQIEVRFAAPAAHPAGCQMIRICTPAVRAKKMPFFLAILLEMAVSLFVCFYDVFEFPNVHGTTYSIGGFCFIIT